MAVSKESDQPDGICGTSGTLGNTVKQRQTEVSETYGLEIPFIDFICIQKLRLGVI